MNEGNSAVISRKDSPVTVRVMKTNEELMIARHTRDLIVYKESGRLPEKDNLATKPVTGGSND